MLPQLALPEGWLRGRVGGQGMSAKLRAVLLVAGGGAVGTAARYLLGALTVAVTGSAEAHIAATLFVNLTGAFALGWLIEALARRGPDTGRRRELRLLLGTGLLGGYTTYSTLALDAVTLLGGGVPLAVLYGLGTVVLGAVASVAGIAVGRRGQPGHPGRAGRAVGRARARRAERWARPEGTA